MLFENSWMLEPTSNLTNLEEGFLKGNMFKDEYVSYQNMTYLPLKANNDEERLLYKVISLSFAINDLNLYLDINPMNKEVFKKLQEYINEYKKEKNEYVKKYGSLNITDVNSSFDWINNPWPWEDRGGKNYV